jgi:hypothetical protein
VQRRSGDRLDPLLAPEYPFSSHLFDATDGDNRERKTSLKTLLSVPRLDCDNILSKKRTRLRFSFVQQLVHRVTGQIKLKGDRALSCDLLYGL